MTEILDRVAQAIESAELGYHIRLVSLIDGVSTYEMKYSDGDEVFEFGSHEDALDHYRARLRQVRAVAAIEALREPTAAIGWAMLAARTHLNRQEGERAFTDGQAEKIQICDQLAANPSRWCMPEWRAGIDAALGKP